MNAANVLMSASLRPMVQFVYVPKVSCSKVTIHVQVWSNLILCIF